MQPRAGCRARQPPTKPQPNQSPARTRGWGEGGPPHFSYSRSRPLVEARSAGLRRLLGDGVGEEVFQRRVLLLAEFGVRQGFAREHLVAHGCVVDEDRLYCCGLFQVAGLEVFVDVLIGVVGLVS